MNLKNIGQKTLSIILMLAWLVSGWPSILNFPPKLESAKAVTVPSGVIVAWPSTNASIPSGWSRVTALDATYVRGVPNASTDPGTTGGATTHQHTTSAHNHTVSHTHSSATTSGLTGTTSLASSSNQDADTTTHTHTTGTLSATTDNSGDSSPSSGNTSNDPPYVKVIWIESNGTPTGIPDGALAMFNSTSLPTNWDIYTNSQNAFLKGADASGGDGGGTGGSTTHNHTGEGSHDHTSAHVHPSGTSGNSSQTNNSYPAGTFAAGDAHSHSYSVASGNFGTSNTATLNTSTDDHQPTFQKVAVIENNTGGNSLPTGIIAVWRGTLANIPADWVLADGNNGTPNLLGDFAKGALDTSELGNTGGGTSHSHTGSTHTHTWSSTAHTHTVDLSGDASVTRATGTGSGTFPTAAHTHSVTSGAAGSVTVGNASPNLASTSHLPPYEEVAFIQLRTYDQAAYRFFANDNSTDVGAPMAAQDNAATLTTTGGAFRLRMILRVNGANLPSSGRDFKLQFAQQSGGACDTGFSGESYSDVTGATVIAYNNNTPADGDNLTSNANDPTYTGTINNQDYEEANNFTNSVSAIPAGENGKWDFALKDNGATEDAAYCFRIVTSSGALLTDNGGSYIVVPQITINGASAGTLTLNISDNSIGYGTLSSSQATYATGDLNGSASETVAHTIEASTNASNGYVITVQGATLTSGVNTITAIGGTSAASSPTNEQYGLRITASGGDGSVTSPYNHASQYAYGADATTPDEIASDSNGDDVTTTYSLRYLGNISAQTEAGLYSATPTYVIIANF